MDPNPSDPSARLLAALSARIDALEVDLQAANARNDAQRANLGHLTHALLTPMNAIVGYTRIASRRGKAALDAIGAPARAEQLLREQAQYLESATTAQDHLMRLINQVVDLSKADLNQFDLFFEVEPLEALFGSISRTVEPLTTRSGARLDLSLPATPVTLNTDIAKFRRILITLLSRAAACSPNGRVGLTVDVVGDQLGVAVSDTGMGHSPEALARVFEPFSDPDPAAEPRVRDAGLAIVRHLTQLLGGRVTATSKESQGSTFTVVIPRVHPQAGPQGAGSGAAP